jgi:hypothetical protein
VCGRRVWEKGQIGNESDGDDLGSAGLSLRGCG